MQITMSAPAAAKVKNLEVCYFERKDLVDKKKLWKTPRLSFYGKKKLFRQDNL